MNLYRNRYRFSSTLQVLDAFYVKYCSELHLIFMGFYATKNVGLRYFFVGKT